MILKQYSVLQLDTTFLLLHLFFKITKTGVSADIHICCCFVLCILKYVCLTDYKGQDILTLLFVLLSLKSQSSARIQTIRSLCYTYTTSYNTTFAFCVTYSASVGIFKGLCRLGQMTYFILICYFTAFLSVPRAFHFLFKVDSIIDLWVPHGSKWR